MFFEGALFWTYKGFAFCFAACSNFVFLFFQDMWEILSYIWPLSTDLENARETLFSNVILCILTALALPSAAYSLSWAAERTGFFSLSLFVQVCRSWSLNLYLISTASEMLQYVSNYFCLFYWKYNYSNVSKIENEGIIWCFPVSESCDAACCLSKKLIFRSGLGKLQHLFRFSIPTFFI